MLAHKSHVKPCIYINYDKYNKNLILRLINKI